ncbi:MAG: hypothetical protein HKN42_04985, partial [Granulosicoccus sp.]|nr:hypothetical protein [Granulosicoccus sp.]
RLSDRQLEDSGFSRELLMNGVNDWPWRLDQALVSDAALPGDVAFQTPAPRDSEVRHAIAELKSYSDRELAELGVNRNGIENAVRYGRPSIDDVVDSHKHAA